MNRHTLSLYLASDFARKVLVVFMLFVGLVVAVDMIELSRELSRNNEVTAWDIFEIAALRAPSFVENVLPFATLFGAAGSLMLLNSRLELVVARASGVSVWQFLAPLAITAGLLGLFASVVYNPLAAHGLANSQQREAAAFGRVKANFSNQTRNFWLRVGGRERDTLIRARVAENNGQTLTGVSFYLYLPDNTLMARYDAAKAQYIIQDNGSATFVLSDASRFEPGGDSVPVSNQILPVQLRKSELRSRFLPVDKMHMWQIGDYRQQARENGKPTAPFDTRWHSLWAQPLLFISMVLLAATVSLRFARFGQNTKVIAAGVVSGFVLYVVARLVLTFGSNGLISPIMAGWAPAFVASLIGISVLLHLEDG
ncbi:MAG: LptF/LptG family permease [Pseudomonadota bacterium]